MSDNLSFEDVIDHLQNNPDSAARADAAKLLGDHVDDLSDDEYATAVQALNRALSDPDPMVLMAAMQTLPNFKRAQQQAENEAANDHSGEAVQAAACAVCGRPEALIHPETCEYDNCPYR